MRKYIILLLVILLTSIMNLDFVLGKENNKNVKIKYIVGYVKDKPSFILSTYVDLDSIDMYIPREMREKIKEKVVKNGKILLDENNSIIYVYDITQSDADNVSKVKYLHKIENYISYVSPDGKEWDQLKIKVLPESFKKFDKSHFKVYLYLECKWFKGTYAALAEGWDRPAKEFDYETLRYKD